MRFTLILIWASAVTSRVMKERSETSSIQPDVVYFSNGGRVLQGYGARTGGVLVQTSNLRQQAQPANPYGHQVEEQREAELAHEAEISHMHPYMEAGRSGYYAYAGKKSEKDSSTYNDDEYYTQVDDFYLSETTEGGIGTKKTKGSKGSKTRGDLKAKREKSAKKDGEKKLKASSDPDDDEIALDDDLYNMDGDDFGANDPWATPSPSPVGSESGVGAGSGVPTFVTGAADELVIEGNSTVNDDFVFTTRMGTIPEDGAFSVDIQTTKAMESLPDDFEPADGTGESEPLIMASTLIVSPQVQQELFPDPVELKAHSSVNLQEYDSEFFSETTNFLTPCLQIAYHDYLQAYKLTVDYADGPDASKQGVVITYMNINVVVSVVTDTIDGLKAMTHESASQVVHDCFDGPQLYQFLGSLRREGVEINEIEFQGRPFKSPIFGNSNVGIISNNGDTSPEKHRAGLIAFLTVAMLVIGAVVLAHRRGKLPALHIPAVRIGKLAGSFRKNFPGEGKLGTRTSRTLRERLYNSFHNTSEQGVSALSSDSSRISSIGSAGVSSQQTPVRERSWSGSFRRYPPGGIRPAALQKKPAYSSDLLKTPKTPKSSDDNSYSVQGDYDVPEEYDFQATPISSRSASAKIPIRALSSYSKASSRTEDEFGMPEDYLTVNEEVSLYSRSASVMVGGGNKGYPLDPRTPIGTTTMSSQLSRTSIPQQRIVVGPTGLLSPSEKSATSSMGGHPFSDEWSMASFQTSSPSGMNGHAAVGGASASAAVQNDDDDDDDDASPPPPYRDWHDKPKGDSPGSRLAMPKLSFV